MRELVMRHHRDPPVSCRWGFLAILRTLVITLGCMTAAPLTFADFQQGLDAYQKGEYATAIKWYRLAADQGVVEAQQNLALLYDVGEGVPQDYQAAIKWYTLAAEQGLAAAQFNLALLYEQGHGAAQDYAAAIKWYSSAAEQGNSNAQHNLALAYALAQDYVAAYMWFSIAAVDGAVGKAQDIVSKEMTPAEIEQAQNLARDWQTKHGGL